MRWAWSWTALVLMALLIPLRAQRRDDFFRLAPAISSAAPFSPSPHLVALGQ
jgi:hypothetical protein